MRISKKQLIVKAKENGFGICMGHNYYIDREALELPPIKIEKDSRDSKIYQYDKESKTLTYYDAVIYINGVWSKIINK